MKTNKILFYLFSLMILWASCDDSDIVKRVEPSINIQEELVVKPISSREVIPLRSTYPWFAEASDGWIKLQKYRGQALKEDSIVAILAENPEMETREGWIEVRLMDQLSKRIQVVQVGRGSLITLSKNLIYFNVNGGETILNVYTHVDWEIVGGSGDGFTLTKVDKNKLKVNVAKNTTGAERKKSVVIQSKESDEKATLEIVQTNVEKMLSIPLPPEEKDRILQKQGENLEIPVSLNVKYDCIASDSWISIDETPEFSGDIVQDIVIKASVGANTTGEERDGYIVVKDKSTTDAVSDTLFVAQRARGTIIYVKAGATGDGSTWDMAFGTLEAGMAACDHAGDMELWVAQGVYQLTAPLTWKSVNVYGGFKGDETKLKDRDLKNKSTIKGGDFYPLIQAWNAVPADAWYCMDGFIFTGINAPKKSGVGALEVYKGHIMRNCIFHDNVTNKNTAGYYEGSKLINCLFYNNHNTGWAANVHANNTELYNVTIVNNTGATTVASPGLRVGGTQSVLYNTVIWGNKAGNVPQAYLDANGNSTFVNCAVQDGYVFNGGNTPKATVECITLDKENGAGPQFVDVSGHDYHLQSTSPLIDAGVNNPNKLVLRFDIEGLNRISGAKTDIGAFEFQAK